MDKLICQYNDNSLYEINISYGYEVRESGNTVSLINIYKNADKNMYDYKRGYKESKASCI